MRCLFSLIVLLLLINTASAQQVLSPNAEISVLTIGPGTSLNDAFGHSGFRIKDRTQGLDVVYGYGQYDFDTPNFYLKFAQGKLNYLISKHNFEDFYRAYVYYNRTIKEQVLNITTEEQQVLFNYLQNNYKPENRAYLYDFFYDNCATRIRDVANTALDQNITYNTPEDYQEQTFRTLIQNNLNKNSWGSLGIDIALGSVIDKTATPNEQLFLPENIYRFFSTATLQNGQPLVKQSQELYTKKEQQVSSNFLLSPLFILSILALLIILITYKDYKKKKRSKLLDGIIFSITGCIGIVLLLLWFATDHSATANNYNLLWAFALNVFVMQQVLKQTPSKWFLRYLFFLITMLCLLVFHWLTGVQVFAITLTPLLIALAIRYIFLLRYFKNSTTN
ncbi:DUF4105 domain-containing protein [Gaetbulibacter jejuensis]|uniref:lipoprotein N-acyltransferase Lnb domain-containing protein n=1 Tax=Gaetbulibacter jejuensis TaxID=584607 RepID=UPI00300985F8